MELKEAKLVDTEELERIQIGLGKKFEQELLKGLELYLNGCI